MIVADTNLIAYLHFPGERTAIAEKVLTAEPVWGAPRLWRSEFLNILATAMRNSMLPLEIAFQLIRRAEQLMSEQEFDVPSASVLSLAADSGCSAYDCEFVAVAMDLDVPLVTSDQQVLSDFPDVAISPETFLA